MVAENLRIGLLTEHVTISEVNTYITVEGIMSKLKMMHTSLQQDFSIDKPKIAVLGLNPHAGDEGLIGKEELEIIKPAIADQVNNLTGAPIAKKRDNRTGPIINAVPKSPSRITKIAIMVPTGNTGISRFCQVVTFDLICLLKTTDPQTISVSFAISLGCNLKGPHKLIQFL